MSYLSSNQSQDSKLKNISSKQKLSTPKWSDFNQDEKTVLLGIDKGPGTFKKNSEEALALQRIISKYTNIGEIDGIIGPKTSSGIRKVENYFGLRVTGEPNLEFIRALAIHQSHLRLKKENVVNQDKDVEFTLNNKNDLANNLKHPSSLKNGISKIENLTASQRALLLLQTKINSGETFRLGDKSPAVFGLKQLLNKIWQKEVFSLSTSSSNEFDEKTLSYVRSLQTHSNGRAGEIDGVVGKNFIKEINFRLKDDAAQIKKFVKPESRTSRNSQVALTQNKVENVLNYETEKLGLQKAVFQKVRRLKFALKGIAPSNQASGFMLLGLSRDKSIRLESMGGHKGTPVWAVNNALKEIGSNIELSASSERIKHEAGSTSLVNAKPSTILAIKEFASRPELVNSAVLINGISEEGHYGKIHGLGLAFDIQADGNINEYILNSGNFRRDKNLDRWSKIRFDKITKDRVRHKCFVDKNTGNLFYYEPPNKKGFRGHWHVEVKENSVKKYYDKIDLSRYQYAMNRAANSSSS